MPCKEVPNRNKAKNATKYFFTVKRQRNDCASDFEEELRKAYAKPFGDDFHVDQTWIALACLDLRDVAAVQSEILGKFRLRKTGTLPQGSDSASEPGFHVGPHMAIIACGL